MAENTKIEWCTHTFNAWLGCTKVSPGCDHCYAEAMMDTRLHRVQWGAGQPRVRTSPANWRKPLKWDAAHDEFFARQGRRQRVFCASLADVFDNAAPDQWRRDLAALIASTPNLDWLLLTKRIGNAAAMLAEMFAGSAPGNVWVGATIVNRDEMLRDARKLLAVPARIRFWSVEPMLADLGPIPGELFPDWVICGGESGAQARPTVLEWAESLVSQCRDAGVPIFMKQLGAHPTNRKGEPYLISDNKGALVNEWPETLRVRELPLAA